MNIGNVTGVNAYRRTAAATPPKVAGQKKAVDARSRDRLELQFTDVLTAEKEGYIEVGGKRFAVSEDIAAQMRSAYDEMLARNEAKMARKAAEENARAARQQSEALAEQGEAMSKALEIARRIGKGGHVPPQDEKFLMEYSQEIYMAAKMQGMLAKEHEKYDTLLEDEEESAEEGEGVEAAGDGTRATAEATLSDGAVESVSVGEAPVEVSAE